MPRKKQKNIYRKKRARIFQKKKDPAPATEYPTPVLTASKKKLALSSLHLLHVTPHDHSAHSTSAGTAEPSTAGFYTPPSSLSECAAGREKHGYRLISCERLDAGLQKIGRCCSCNSPLKLEESFSKRKGLVSKISIVCSNFDCHELVLVSDPSSVEATALNKQSVLGMRMIGNGRAKLDTFTACMEMLPLLSPASWAVYNRQVQDEVVKCALSSQVAAASVEWCLPGWGCRCQSECGWHLVQTWLYSPLWCCSWESGQVLDCELLSKLCAACVTRESMDQESAEYQEWWDKHQSRKWTQILSEKFHIPYSDTIIFVDVIDMLSCLNES